MYKQTDDERTNGRINKLRNEANSKANNIIKFSFLICMRCVCECGYNKSSWATHVWSKRRLSFDRNHLPFEQTKDTKRNRTEQSWTERCTYDSMCAYVCMWVQAGRQLGCITLWWPIHRQAPSLFYLLRSVRTFFFSSSCHLSFVCSLNSEKKAYKYIWEKMIKVTQFSHDFASDSHMWARVCAFELEYAYHARSFFLSLTLESIFNRVSE